LVSPEGRSPRGLLVLVSLAARRRPELSAAKRWRLPGAPIRRAARSNIHRTLFRQTSSGPAYWSRSKVVNSTQARAAGGLISNRGAASEPALTVHPVILVASGPLPVNPGRCTSKLSYDPITGLFTANLPRSRGANVVDWSTRTNRTSSLSAECWTEPPAPSPASLT